MMKIIKTYNHDIYRRKKTITLKTIYSNDDKNNVEQELQVTVIKKTVKTSEKTVARQDPKETPRRPQGDPRETPGKPQ